MFAFAVLLCSLPGATDPHRTLMIARADMACVDPERLAAELTLRLPDLQQHRPDDGVADLGYSLTIRASEPPVQGIWVQLQDPLELPLAETQLACTAETGLLERQLALFVEDHLRLHRERFARLLRALTGVGPQPTANPTVSQNLGSPVAANSLVSLRMTLQGSSDRVLARLAAGVQTSVHVWPTQPWSGWLEFATTLPHSQQHGSTSLTLQETSVGLGFTRTLPLGTWLTEARLGYAQLLIGAQAERNGSQSPRQWRQAPAVRIGIGGFRTLAPALNLGVTLQGDWLVRAPVWTYRGEEILDQGHLRLHLGLCVAWLAGGT